MGCRDSLDGGHKKCLFRSFKKDDTKKLITTKFRMKSEKKTQSERKKGGKSRQRHRSNVESLWKYIYMLMCKDKPTYRLMLVCQCVPLPPFRPLNCRIESLVQKCSIEMGQLTFAGCVTCRALRVFIADSGRQRCRIKEEKSRGKNLLHTQWQRT